VLYTVKARLRGELSHELYERLTDGSINGQEPDGAEIVASMKRARVSTDGAVRWSERCLCPTPLQHERDTVYDRYFAGMEVAQTPEHVEYEGEPLMDVLRRSPRN